MFTMMLPLYAWLILAEQIVEFTPLAYETVFQNMQDPVVVVDDQGRIIGLNHRAENLLDISETAALLEPLDLVMGEGATQVFEALESGEPRKMMTDTGRYLHVQVSPMSSTRASVRDGKVLMFRDVSDVERAQAEVRANEALLRTLIDHSVNGIIRLRWQDVDSEKGKELRCIFANAAAEKFLSTRREDLVGELGEDIVKIASSAMDLADANDIADDFRRATQVSDSVDTEVQHSASDGTARWLRMICEPVGDDIAATFVDVTDGKARERHMESIAWTDPHGSTLLVAVDELDAPRTARLEE